jgi:hypothetical protein
MNRPCRYLKLHRVALTAVLAACAPADEGDAEVEARQETLAPDLVAARGDESLLGREVGATRRLADGDEYLLSTRSLVRFGRAFFVAVWTPDEGGGRPLTKGTGAPLSDATAPLVFPRDFNRISAPDANACSGCHNHPVIGAGGDFVTNVFVLGQRFDFATFDPLDTMPLRGSRDESGNSALLDTVANSRATLGMNGSGYIEMLARQMTADLQATRDTLAPGAERALVSKGVSFGMLARRVDGTWDTSRVTGLPAPSLASADAASPPNLIIRPFHQAGAVISLRQFTVNAMNHHHGIQATERFGRETDPDGDGFVAEMTRAEISATTLFQATLPVPGRVIPRDYVIEKSVRTGERVFDEIGCASCHVRSLPLDREGWKFSEPNPYNPAGNLRPGDAPSLVVNLASGQLPPPRLKPVDGVVHVPALTDLKLHDLCDGPNDPNREAIDMHAAAGSGAFFAGNCRFLTRKLWGVANEPPYFHHGKFTTLRQAILGHGGEAAASRAAFLARSTYEQASIIEFLKTLRVLPSGTTALIVDEYGDPRSW